jgi:hypothetical protein
MALHPNHQRTDRSLQAQSPLIVQLLEIAPVQRNPGVPWFHRDRTVKILRAFVANDALPPVPVHELPTGSYRYALRDGFHRFYASAAAGFNALPIEILPYFDIATGAA